MDGTALNLILPAASGPAPRPLIVDSFAGGGGASTGIELALGRSPDIAINHDAAALSMHEANHPETLHLNSNIWRVDPRDACKGRPVGLAWFSPDCKHHSKAKGGKPVEKNIRDLAWVVVMWAQRVKPDVIMLENVEEFRDWCPLTPDNKPDPERRGETFDLWVKQLRALGYRVQHRELRACDYGAPTIRKRLFVIARRDGLPIVWPEPTHGAPDSAEVLAGKRKPWRTAAEIIDWSLPCPSIFDTSEEIMAKFGLRAVRPLKDATLRRIARGVMRYVVEAQQPFIVGCGGRMGQSPERPVSSPMQTLTAKADSCVVTPFVSYAQQGGMNRPADAPLSTLTTRGTQQQVVAAHMMSLHGTSRRDGQVDAPHPTICAGGQHSALVAAFLQKYYGQGLGQQVSEPLHTVATRDTFGVVTVEIDGQTYAIEDIGMRMLTPREQFRAQGFPDTYRIDTGADGRQLTKTEQTRMCGNSVCPPLAEALVRANCAHLAEAAIRREA